MLYLCYNYVIYVVNGFRNAAFFFDDIMLPESKLFTTTSQEFCCLIPLLKTEDISMEQKQSSRRRWARCPFFFHHLMLTNRGRYSRTCWKTLWLIVRPPKNQSAFSGTCALARISCGAWSGFLEGKYGKWNWIETWIMNEHCMSNVWTRYCMNHVWTIFSSAHDALFQCQLSIYIYITWKTTLLSLAVLLIIYILSIWQWPIPWIYSQVGINWACAVLVPCSTPRLPALVLRRIMQRSGWLVQFLGQWPSGSLSAVGRHGWERERRGLDWHDHGHVQSFACWLHHGHRGEEGPCCLDWMATAMFRQRNDCTISIVLVTSTLRKSFRGHEGEESWVYGWVYIGSVYIIMMFVKAESRQSMLQGMQQCSCVWSYVSQWQL